jgi:hypothetical protein
VDVPLPWERVLWRGQPAFWNRLAPPTGERYWLTDFRLVRISPGNIDELPLVDIGDIQRVETYLNRLTRTSTLVIRPHDPRRREIVLRGIRRGAQLAALVELLSSDPHADVDAESARAALQWEPRLSTGGFRELAAGIAAVVIAVSAVVFGFHGKAVAVTYPADDAIYPNGRKKDRAAIERFMRDEVMPWARSALGPLKGGGDRVQCETCHGKSPEARDWQMPAVAALPEPTVREKGWEQFSSGMDAQMRNAIYGYLADADKQTKAAYMRDIVMPGMARLLHRPAYDFTKPYAYNRARLAFGCYHCHRVR